MLTTSAIAVVARRSLAVRSFQTSNGSMGKLREILDDYVQNNFNQGLPSNFMTPIINEVHEPEDGMIDPESAVRALQKLEAKNNMRLSDTEAWEVLNHELGGVKKEDSIAQERFNRIFFDNVSQKSRFGLP